MQRNKLSEHMTVGFIIGVIFLAVLQKIKDGPSWLVIPFVLGYVVIFILAIFFFLLSNKKDEEKMKNAEWEEAIKLAQTRDPRINNRMYYVLRKEAIASFLKEDEVALETHINEEIINKKADFILKVFKDLIPLYEEKKESQE